MIAPAKDRSEICIPNLLMTSLCVIAFCGLCQTIGIDVRRLLASVWTKDFDDARPQRRLRQFTNRLALTASICNHTVYGASSDSGLGAVVEHQKIHSGQAVKRYYMNSSDLQISLKSCRDRYEYASARNIANTICPSEFYLAKAPALRDQPLATLGSYVDLYSIKSAACANSGNTLPPAVSDHPLTPAAHTLSNTRKSAVRIYEIILPPRALDDAQSGAPLW